MLKVQAEAEASCAAVSCLHWSVRICDQMKLLLLLCNAQNVVLSIEVDACSK